MNAHDGKGGDDEKNKRIRAIKAEGLSPIVRVVAAGLSEDQALLVEKTLIWKLGKQLLNIASGSFSANFRPQNTLHKHLPKFDFQNGIYYVNVGEGSHRLWEDCRKYGFMSAGQGANWRNQILGLQAGDIIVAYLKDHGYVGVARVIASAVPINQFALNKKPLSSYSLRCTNMYDNCHDAELSEYLVRVGWIKEVSKENAYWKPNAGLFTTALIRASLANQDKTLRFIEKSFKLDFAKLG